MITSPTCCHGLATTGYLTLEDARSLGIKRLGNTAFHARVFLEDALAFTGNVIDKVVGRVVLTLCCILGIIG
jgi:hypothetical protein